jgi:hypothetical protein
MKTIRFFLTLMLVPFIFSSCQKISGKGDTVSENRTILGYSSIGLSMSADVYFTSGPAYELVVTAQENLLPYVETYVSGSQLVIRVKKGVVLGPHHPVQIQITAPGVTSLSVGGSGDIHVMNNWAGMNLETTVSGSGNIAIQTLEAGTFTGTISGSGNIEASGGTAGREDLNISGSGKIGLQGVSSGTTESHISGSGDIYTNVSDLLNATISGSGSVYYSGSPVMNIHISGSGTVKRI